MSAQKAEPTPKNVLIRFTYFCIIISIIKLNWMSIYNKHSIYLAEGSQLKNQSPLVPVAHLNRAEAKKADIPVLGKDWWF